MPGSGIHAASSDVVNAMAEAVGGKICKPLFQCETADDCGMLMTCQSCLKITAGFRCENTFLTVCCKEVLLELLRLRGSPLDLQLSDCARKILFLRITAQAPMPSRTAQGRGLMVTGASPTDSQTDPQLNVRMKLAVALALPLGREAAGE